MTYDPELAGRLRAALSFHDGIIEKSMFGGRAFLKDGQLLASASSRGGMLLRVDPAVADQLVATGRAERFLMRGRTIAGWLYVDDRTLDTEDDLRALLDLGLDYLSTLPPKR